jgi:hypothetical protein
VAQNFIMMLGFVFAPGADLVPVPNWGSAWDGPAQGNNRRRLGSPAYCANSPKFQGGAVNKRWGTVRAAVFGSLETGQLKGISLKSPPAGFYRFCRRVGAENTAFPGHR